VIPRLAKIALACENLSTGTGDTLSLGQF